MFGTIRQSCQVQLERVDPQALDWAQLDALPGQSAFQSREWLEFLAETQAGEPVVARVVSGSETAGWFTGMIVRRYGIRILGSPFQGWTTGPMGFSLRDEVDRGEAAAALPRFAFRELGCMHVELLDRQLTFGDLAGVGGQLAESHSFEIDLTRDEDALFGGMSSACRRAVRKSEKSGVRVERASEHGFAEEYYAQLEDVFARQSLTPPYPLERVRALIRHLVPKDRLLLMRAVDPSGRSIATGIFPISSSLVYLWGAASWRESRILRPNEALYWQAMRTAKEMGVPLMDLGGGGDYKRKYGGEPVVRPFLRKARAPGLLAARNTAQRVYWRAATRGR